MKATIRAALNRRGAGIVRVVDLSPLGPGALGYPRAVLLGAALSAQFVRDTIAGRPCPDDYLPKEAAIEALADRLARALRVAGWRAQSQSTRSNLLGGRGEGGFADPELLQGVSPLPQKTVARLAGLGFVGRNNLLVTRRYGCALVLCSVLTDAPFAPDPAQTVEPGCARCRRCVDACASGALTGGRWSCLGNRAALLDVSRCRCPLACMMACPWTRRYAGLE